MFEAIFAVHFMEKVTNNAVSAGRDRRSLLLFCCDRCPVCLFFLIVLENGHPAKKQEDEFHILQSDFNQLHLHGINLTHFFWARQVFE